MCGTGLTVDDHLHKIYLDLLKRMDDASDEVRMVVAKTWQEYFKVSASTEAAEPVAVTAPATFYLSL